MTYFTCTDILPPLRRFATPEEIRKGIYLFDTKEIGAWKRQKHIIDRSKDFIIATFPYGVRFLDRKFEYFF